MDRKYFLKEYLNWFWLRPENAIMVALRAEKYAETFKDFDSNSIDVSCGDGVFSYIAAGGQINDSVDMFSSLNLSEDRKGNFDTFDHYDDSYRVITSRPADYVYEYGSDWKMNLLNKANCLGYYQNLMCHDNNIALEFNEGRFGYVYSNSAYWVENFEQHLNDLVRITKPGGTIVLEMKTDTIQRYSSYNYAANFFGNRFCEIIDAGRLSTWKGLKSRNECVDILGRLKGAQIVSEAPLYGDILAYIWDIGLRPLFKPLVNLANNVDPLIRLESKREWCNIFYELFEIAIDKYQPTQDDAIEWIYVLRKDS